MSDIDIKTFSPVLTNCPYCKSETDGQQYVDVMDSDPFESSIDTTSDVMSTPTFETTRCIRFMPCGHAFEKDSIGEITDALHELRQLRRERRECEDAERLREYDYEIEAQVHAVNNRVSGAVHREEADADE